MQLILIRNKTALTFMVALLLLSISWSYAQLREKKILMVIPLKDYWDEELLKPKEIFEQNGFVVSVASSTTKKAKGMFGTITKPDLVLHHVKATQYDAIVFVGGEGAIQYWDDRRAHQLIREALKKGKVLGAMSIAPITLANAKVLIGRKATVWPSLGNRLKMVGTIYTGEPVEVDGKIVTADGPSSAEDFAWAILRIILLK
jgi:protease I